MTCPKCQTREADSRHHIYPKRHYGCGKRNNCIIFICRICHTELEQLIPMRKMPKNFYLDIIELFLMKGDVKWIN